MWKKIVIWFISVLSLSGILFFSGYLIGAHRTRVKLSTENQARELEFRRSIENYKREASRATEASQRAVEQIELSRNVLSRIGSSTEQSYNEIELARGSVQSLVVAATELERIFKEIKEAEQCFNSWMYSDPDNNQYYYRYYSLRERE